MKTRSGVPARWRRRSVRFQVATIVGLVAVLLVLLNAVLLGEFLRQHVLDTHGTALAKDAAILSRCRSNGIAVEMFEERPAAAGLVQAVLGATQTRHAILVTNAGTVRYATPMPRDLQATLLARLDHDLALHRLGVDGAPPWHLVRREIIVESTVTCGGARAPAAIVARAPTQGGLLLAEDQQVAESDWRQLLSLVLVAGLATALLAGFASLLVGEAIARPLRALTGAARAFAAGETRRRAVPEGPAEINEMARAFNRMVDEVERQRRVERDLLANISHELASPLGLIRGYTEALADGVIASEPERKAALRAVGLETARLQRLTADLLDLSLLETGQVPLHLEEVPVPALLSGLRERLSPRFAEAGITSSVETAPDLPNVVTDGQRLEQVLVNLLNNAARHTPPGGSIVMTADQESEDMVITVRDDGVGIPPDELSRIWERFYRVEKGRDRRQQDAGVGLGLAIVRSTVNLLQGTIDVSSAHGSGTTFSIRLPFHPTWTPNGRGVSGL